MAMPHSMDALLDDFVSWAEKQPDIRAAAIVGSHARADRPADKWSDLDLAIIVTDPQVYLSTTDWLAHIAVPHLSFLEPTAVGNMTERRVLFDGARDVDFSFIPTTIVAQWRRQGLADDVALVAQRGLRLLFDKDGDFRALLSIVPPRPIQHVVPPSEAIFTALINDFLYHVLWCAKKLYRGELWFAALACNGDLKHRLLRMIEWHAQVRHHWQLDSWHGGRFLEHWAAPEVLAALPGTFAGYNSDAVQRALMDTLNLFHHLATIVARDLHLPYPDAAYAYVLTWIQEQAATREPSA